LLFNYQTLVELARTFVILWNDMKYVFWLVVT